MLGNKLPNTDKWWLGYFVTLIKYNFVLHFSKMYRSWFPDEFSAIVSLLGCGVILEWWSARIDSRKQVCNSMTWCLCILFGVSLVTLVMKQMFLNIMATFTPKRFFVICWTYMLLTCSCLCRSITKLMVGWLIKSQTYGQNHRLIVVILFGLSGQWAGHGFVHICGNITGSQWIK